MHYPCCTEYAHLPLTSPMEHRSRWTSGRMDFGRCLPEPPAMPEPWRHLPDRMMRGAGCRESPADELMDNMAICFELVVNFEANVEAAQAAALANPTPMTLQAGSHRIPLHWALLSGSGAYIELSVLPVSISWGLPMDGTLPRTRLADGTINGLVL
jgi:hypothetical protein